MLTCCRPRKENKLTLFVVYLFFPFYCVGVRIVPPIKKNYYHINLIDVPFTGRVKTDNYQVARACREKWSKPSSRVLAGALPADIPANQMSDLNSDAVNITHTSTDQPVKLAGDWAKHLIFSLSFSGCRGALEVLTGLLKYFQNPVYIT